ncbi:RM09 protein, partial [Onychorhynchus coronatus]|nr:RM09 protein [Onychorhynchus coronatus]
WEFPPSAFDPRLFLSPPRTFPVGTLGKLELFPLFQTLKFLRRCRLEVGMKNNVKWELTPEIVARHFLKNLGVFVPPHAVKLPEEPITRWGDYWCDVTVRG